MTKYPFFIVDCTSHWAPVGPNLPYPCKVVYQGTLQGCSRYIAAKHGVAARTLQDFAAHREYLEWSAGPCLSVDIAGHWYIVNRGTHTLGPCHMCDF